MIPHFLASKASVTAAQVQACYDYLAGLCANITASQFSPRAKIPSRRKDMATSVEVVHLVTNRLEQNVCEGTTVVWIPGKRIFDPESVFQGRGVTVARLTIGRGQEPNNGGDCDLDIEIFKNGVSQYSTTVTAWAGGLILDQDLAASSFGAAEGDIIQVSLQVTAWNNTATKINGIPNIYLGCDSAHTE